MRDTFICMRARILILSLLTILGASVTHAQTYSALADSLNPSPIPTVQMPQPYLVPQGTVATNATTSTDSIQTLTSLIAQLQKLQILLATLQFGNASTTYATNVYNPQNIDTSPVEIKRTLTRGMAGKDVLALQKLLVDEGFLASDAATGFYGDLTVEAVQEYQSHYGIVMTGTPATTGYGVVGPKTRISINAALRGAREAQ